MKHEEELKNLIEKQIDLSSAKIQFKIELKGKNGEKYIITEKEENYQLEKKAKNKSFKSNLSSFEEVKNQKELSEKDKKIFFELFAHLNKGQTDKISISGLKLKNPVLTTSIGQSILANVSKLISSEERKDLYILWKKGGKDKERFKEKFYDIVASKILILLENKLNSDDLPTPISPTSVALSETPNYYICSPKETYVLDTKIELFRKLADSICGRCGQRLYSLYVPEEGFEIKEILNTYVLDFYNVNIGSIAGIGKINFQEIGAFEYVFYLLDRVFQELFRRNKIPDHHIELFVTEGIGGRKKFFYYYIIPNLNEVFYKLYHGDEKYLVTASGKTTSKIKALIASFLVENWNIDNKLKENNSQIAHAYINRLLYYIFCHKRLDIDSIIFLEDLKIKLGDTTPILFLEEVMSWM